MNEQAIEIILKRMDELDEMIGELNHGADPVHNRFDTLCEIWDELNRLLNLLGHERE